MTNATPRIACTRIPRFPTDEIVRASAAFLAVSPQVSPVPQRPGTWWIGLLPGPHGDEHALANALRALATVWHPEARVAVADSCVAAHAATWSTRAVHAPLHIAVGDDEVFLAHVPLAFLPMDAEMRAALIGLGLRTAGALARLDPLDVERRWGADGLEAWRLAHGLDDRRATLLPVEDPRTVTHELGMSVTTAEPVLFVLRASLEHLVRTLVEDGRAAAALQLTLTLDAATSALPHTGQHAPRATRTARLPRPVARVMPLFERCRALLDGWFTTLDAPVRAVELRITETVASAAEQGDAFALSWHDPAVMDAALERLRAVLGADSVVRPVRRDTYLPERAGTWQPVERLQPMLVRERPAPAAPTAPAARILESAEVVSLTLDRRGTPHAMTWRGHRFRLVRAEGPERLSGEWWNPTPFKREYWRCECAEDGRTFLVYREASGPTPGWRVQGWYD